MAKPPQPNAQHNKHSHPELYKRTERHEEGIRMATMGESIYSNRFPNNLSTRTKSVASHEETIKRKELIV